MLDLGSSGFQGPGRLPGGHASLDPVWPCAKLLRMLDLGSSGFQGPGLLPGGRGCLRP